MWPRRGTKLGKDEGAEEADKLGSGRAPNILTKFSQGTFAEC